jgi:aryl-alcohol dehydrogenase-like predicted oxidoreductase
MAAHRMGCGVEREHDFLGALHPYPESFKLMTKVGARRDAAGRAFLPQCPDELREGVEANLRSLRVERVNLINLRLVETRGDAAVPLEEQLSALEKMRQVGKLDLIGISNTSKTDGTFDPRAHRLLRRQPRSSAVERVRRSRRSPGPAARSVRPRCSRRA